jgi:hypothetical protein
VITGGSGVLVGQDTELFIAGGPGGPGGPVSKLSGLLESLIGGKYIVLVMITLDYHA